MQKVNNSRKGGVKRRSVAKGKGQWKNDVIRILIL